MAEILSNIDQNDKENKQSKIEDIKGVDSNSFKKELSSPENDKKIKNHLESKNLTKEKLFSVLKSPEDIIKYLNDIKGNELYISKFLDKILSELNNNSDYIINDNLNDLITDLQNKLDENFDNNTANILDGLLSISSNDKATALEYIK